jgi:hypothetical protein
MEITNINAIFGIFGIFAVFQIFYSFSTISSRTLDDVPRNPTVSLNPGWETLN